MTYTPRKIAICVPCKATVHAGFTFDLNRLSAQWSANHVARGSSLFTFTNEGTLIADQREKLAEHAILAGAEGILWVDSDMRFPKDGLDRLMAHGKEVVAASYASRRLPVAPVAFKDRYCRERVYTRPESTGLEKIHAVGMGFCYTATSVFEKLSKPWFMIGYSLKNNDFMGEDVAFFHQLAARGIDAWVDHDLTKEIGHIGTFEYNWEHALSCEEDVKQAEAKAAAEKAALRAAADAEARGDG